MQLKLKHFIVLFLLKAGDEAQSEGVIKTAIRAGFPGVAFPEFELRDAIRITEGEGLIAGVKDDFLGGYLWALTPKGKIKAQQIA